ncbi:SPOR domain-containing protein [Pseudocolwellia agarivorans]|uniref:SPOR domain-containing protein n=1 Tax=Pseudocolwellia agarivorans TaxID=1911682 RepID=UPI003F880D64
MAHQDYVSRPRNPKKSPYKKPAAKQQPQGVQPKVKLIGLITLIAVCLFVYFLWSIKGDETTAPAVQQTQTTEAPKVADTVKDKATLPTPPKEKWAYRKELEDKKIEVGEYDVKQGGPYKMQCGSFKSLKQAEVLKANIAFAGLSAQIGAPVGPNSTYYRVYLGPYEKKRDAEKDKHKLKRNKINYCQIWLWN